MTTYGIYFSGRTSAEALTRALHAAYGVAADLVYAGPYERLNAHPGPDPMVMILPVDGDFGWELRAGRGLAELTGATEVELAQRLCQVARTRALVDEGTGIPDYWLLVAEDGSSGRVMTDPESDELTVLHALEPIAGAPDIDVIPPDEP